MVPDLNRIALRRWARRLRDLAGPRRRPLVGKVRFGDLARPHPISSEFGYDRGTPVDRCYIEEFLARCTEDIRGRVPGNRR